MIFTPPIPENMAFSFYVQGAKLSFAVYHTSVQGKSSGYFKHFVRPAQLGTFCSIELIFFE
jgi:hypothetical protein